MTSIALLMTYVGCLSSGAMLSMLLLLVGAYISASLWLISHGVLYTGLLYVLVYVGAIVVLIMFVVQLTNTSLSGDNTSLSRSIVLLQNTILITCITILIAGAYSILSVDMLYQLSSFNLSTTMVSPTSTLVANLESYIDYATDGNNLSVLAFSIFNEYSYVLVLSVHAILLAIIGPIKLAIADLK